MLKNASVGEHIFWAGKHYKIRKGEMEVRKEYTLILKNEPPYPKDFGVMYEEQLNGFMRSTANDCKDIIAESEIANHESRYMKNNSKLRNFV